MIPIENRADLMNLYASGYRLLKDTLKSLPEECLHFKPKPEAWSIHEIVIHLADSEANAYVRCRKLIAENGSAVAGYDQDTWAVELDYSNQKIKRAVKLFKYLRKSTTEILAQVPEDVWNTHAIVHPEHGSMTLDDWLRTYARHVPLHIGQMNRNLEAWQASQKS